MSQFTSELSSFRQKLLSCQLQKTSLESILHYLQITVNISFPQGGNKSYQSDSTTLCSDFHIANDQVNLQFTVSNQEKPKQKEFFLQYISLKHRVTVVVLCPRHSLLLWPSHECCYMHFLQA